MGESCVTLTVLDVADALQDKFAFISGGVSHDGCPLITFPDTQTGNQRPVTDQQYRDVVTYLTSIPAFASGLPIASLDEADRGFTVIIDRRSDRWGAVKTMLSRLADYFPGLISAVLVLRPSGFLQRTFGEIGYKVNKENFKFKVLLLSSPSQLLDHADLDQLTSDFGGSLPYDHVEWINHRAAIEKFSSSTASVGASLRTLCARLQAAEFPNTTDATEELIVEHQQAQSQVIEELRDTINHGETLRRCLRTVKDPSSGQDVDLGAGAAEEALPRSKLVHITALERLLVQLEETEAKFGEFWQHHDLKLRQCLQLRQFEESFKTCQVRVREHVMRVHSLPEPPGDSVGEVDAQLKSLDNIHTDAQEDVSAADHLRESGESLMSADHYAVDCIRPKCAELQRLAAQYRELERRQREILTRAREIHARIDAATRWCESAVSHLASTDDDAAESAMSVSDLEELLAAAPSNLNIAADDGDNGQQQLLQQVLSHHTQTQLASARARVEDVRARVEKRRSQLRRRSERPVQAVLPVQQENQQSSPVKTVTSDDHDATTANYSSATLKRRGSNRRQMRHVMKELIDTERVYVAEVRTILEGYADRLEEPGMQHLIPQQLVGKADVLFGNLRQIYRFHNDVFLSDLEKCKNTPSLVGKCFVERKEEFGMYGEYCQNKPRSEALRKQVGDMNPFFKACQAALGHQLPLGAYLLKPVQRLTKYQLLLKEIRKVCEDDAGGVWELDQAVSAMLAVLRYVNDMMHQTSIAGFPGTWAEQGKLLMQGAFSVWADAKRIRDIRFKPMQRHLFLFENAVIFCKRKDMAEGSGNHGAGAAEKASYIYKNMLAMREIGMTENVRGDQTRKKFELWSPGRTEVYCMQAPTLEIKDSWVKEIKRLLLRQFDSMKRRSHKEVMTVPVSQLFAAMTTAAASQSQTGSAHLTKDSQSAPDNNNGSPAPAHQHLSIIPESANQSFSSPAHSSSSQLDTSSSRHSISSSHSSTTGGAGSGGQSESLRHSPTSVLESQSESSRQSVSSSSSVSIWDRGNQQVETATTPGSRPLSTSSSTDLPYGYSMSEDEAEFINLGAEIGCSSTEDGDQSLLPLYVALADYAAEESGELSLSAGDVVSVIKMGREGWWYVRRAEPGTIAAGWAPATYLDAVSISPGNGGGSRPNSCHSNMSTSTSASTGSLGKIQELQGVEV